MRSRRGACFSLLSKDANLPAEAGRDQWTQTASVAAEPLLDPDFDQALGRWTRAAEIAHAADRGWVLCRRGAVRVVVH